MFPSNDRLTLEMESAFNGMRGCVVIPSIHNPNFYNLYAITISLIKSKSKEVSILLVNEHKQDCKLCQRAALARNRMKSWIKQQNLAFQEFSIEEFRFKSHKFMTPQKFKSELHLLSPILRNSILSFYATSKLQSDSLDSLPFRHLWNFQNLKNQFSFAKEVLGKSEDGSLIENEPSKFDFIVSLNGRYPFQSGVRDYCQSKSIRYVSLEHGQRHGVNMHLADFQPQEIRNLDKWIFERLSNSNQSNLGEIARVGKEWLEKQETDRIQNIFLGSAVTQNIEGDGKSLLICTSSLDERFSNLGVDLNDWNSQYQAYNSVIKKAVECDMNTTLKIHPNALNKSIKDLWKLYRHLSKWENLRILSPWTDINVFELIEKNDFFVTWGSSLMISAAIREKRGFLLGPTNFMSTLSVPVFGPSDVSNLNFENLETLSKEKALIAAGIVRNWGYDIQSFIVRTGQGHFSNGIAEQPFNKFDINYHFIKFRERILRRYRFIVALTKGRYVTPNEIVNFLSNILFLPRYFAVFLVRISFFALLKSQKNND